jgi:hypothetical protein
MMLIYKSIYIYIYQQLALTSLYTNEQMNCNCNCNCEVEDYARNLYANRPLFDITGVPS